MYALKGQRTSCCICVLIQGSLWGGWCTLEPAYSVELILWWKDRELVCFCTFSLFIDLQAEGAVLLVHQFKAVVLFFLPLFSWY